MEAIPPFYLFVDIYGHAVVYDVRNYFLWASTTKQKQWYFPVGWRL